VIDSCCCVYKRLKLIQTQTEELSIEVDCEPKNEDGEIIPQVNTTTTPDIDF
jgi:hypothetical protein